MSALLRSLLVVGFAGLVLVGCGEKEEAAPADDATTAAPAATTDAAPAAEAPAATDSGAPATGGGYEPTAEERVPGITIDPAAPPAAGAAPAADAAAPAAEPAPAGTEAPAAP